jgi:uncharacterized protein YkwD
LVVLAFFGAGCGVGGSRADARMAALAAPSRPCPSADTSGVVQLVNDVRRRAGLRELGTDAHLARIAAERSAAMAAERRLSHRGWERMLRGAGLRDDQLGENVAYNYADASAVMEGWMQSPGHRANILRRDFKRIGVGCVVDERGHRWWTQDFAG